MSIKEKTILVENELRVISNYFNNSSDEMIIDFVCFFSDAKKYLLENTTISNERINWFYDTCIMGQTLETADFELIIGGIRKMIEVKNIDD